MRLIPLAAATLVVAATLPGLAAAAEARASGNVPVRWGPGFGYDIIDRLDNGAYYEVEDCTRQARWCLVSEDGEELGWVPGSYLVGSAAKNRAAPFELLVRPKWPFQD